MSNTIQLIVGLGNPGPEYAETRHNAGAWLVNLLSEQQRSCLRPESKFFGLCAKGQLDEIECRLLIPTTFMNRSGQAVKALANFYRIPPDAILVVHDELDLPVGTARFKQGGGDGGHNGLKDISAQLGTKDYWRLRLGVGHPGHRDHVIDYVLNKPSRADYQQIMNAIENALLVLPQFVKGDMQQAIQKLHTIEN